MYCSSECYDLNCSLRNPKTVKFSSHQSLKTKFIWLFQLPRQLRLPVEIDLAIHYLLRTKHQCVQYVVCCTKSKGFELSGWGHSSTSHCDFHKDQHLI